MEVEYEVTPEDYVRFIMFHYAHSPRFRRNRLIYRTLPAVAFILFGLVVYLAEGKVSAPVIVVILSSTWFLVSPLWWRRNIRRRLNNVMAEGRQPQETEHCRLTIADDGLHSASNVGESSIKWSAVEKVAQSDTHTYIYLGPMSALMVPHAAFGSDAERDAFVAAARRYADSAANPPSSS